MRAPRPAAGDEDPTDDVGQPTGVQHLSPSGAQGDQVGRCRVEVAVEVVPHLTGPLMPQPPVQLDEGPKTYVLDVPVHSRAASRDQPLASPDRQTMCALDVPEVSRLQR